MSRRHPHSRAALLALIALTVSAIAPAWLAHAHGLGAASELAWSAAPSAGVDSNAPAHDPQHCRVCQHRTGTDRLVVLELPAPVASLGIERLHHPDSPVPLHDGWLSGHRLSRSPPASR